MGQVLCYHSVSNDWDDELAVTERAFEWQLTAMLRRRFRPVAAETAIAGGGHLFHVTFDDAYRDIAGALDKLERLRVPATVFAATSFADGGRPLAVPELLNEIAAHSDRLATMDWDELRDLVARGFEIGSHTVSHPHLPRLSDAELDAELLDSRLRCEDELGAPCRYLAYPYGEHDERVRAAARRAGYTAAFALHEPGPQDDPFALPRVDLYRGDSRLTATVKTSSARRPAYALAHRLRTRWPSAAPYGHGWMVATLPATASRLRVEDSLAAATLMAAGAQVVDRDADVEIGNPAALSGEATVVISPFAAPPHDAGALALRVARRLYNSLRIRAVALRGRRAIRRLGYPDVEVIAWDVAQTFRRPGGPAAERRSLVERLPQRALVIGRRGARGPSLLDMVLAEASRCGANGFESAPPNMRTGGVVIVTTGETALRAALGAA